MLTDRQLFFTCLAQTSDSPICLEIVRAEGIYLFDASGKRFLDLISGISVSNTGHRHPKVVKAIKSQVDNYLHLMVYGEYIQSPQVRLADKLTRLLPAKLNNCYFVNSGSEAVEGALKLAKRYTGRSRMIAFHNAYHGSSHGSLSMMGNDTFKQPFLPLLPDVKHIELNDLTGLEEITSDTACVILEPVQGEAGVMAATTGFMLALREKCDYTGTLLIFDEIQTGLGRTGSMFAFERYGVTPDILLLAKALGGGMPLGAFIAPHYIMSTLSSNPALGHITTFGGHPVCCAAALANLEVILREKLVEQVAEKSRLFVELLRNCKPIRQIRAEGLLIALQLDNFNQVKTLIERCLSKGVILDWFLFNDSSVRIAPPLTILNTEIEQACQVLLTSLQSI